jgi:hypothetical protein
MAAHETPMLPAIKAAGIKVVIPSLNIKESKHEKLHVVYEIWLFIRCR